MCIDIGRISDSPSNHRHKKDLKYMSMSGTITSNFHVKNKMVVYSLIGKKSSTPLFTHNPLETILTESSD